MSKIKKLTVSNLKAIGNQSASFEGCTAIITGGNNKGKTSFLRSLFDRVRGIKADTVLKDGETEGFAEAELTTGEKIKWEFNDKGKGFKEKLTYITEKEIKTSLTTELRTKFLPDTFDVDKFLADQPMKQRKTLQDLAGLDFTDIDKRYKNAYEARTAANTLHSDAKTIFDATAMPAKVETVDLKELLAKKETERIRLNTQYLANKEINRTIERERHDACALVDAQVDNFNEKQNKLKAGIELAEVSLQNLVNVGYKGKEVQIHIDALKAIQKPLQEASKLYPAALINLEDMPDDYQPAEDVKVLIKERPNDKDLQAIDKEIADATQKNIDAVKYTNWLELQNKKNTATEIAKAANDLVISIEKERMDLIKSAKMPEGFSFTNDGIAYNGLTFTREQLSSSGIYIAALKLASMKMGEIRTLHFDASFLDKNSLTEIEQWANTQNLQLLIERPDFEGGEITYELITT